MVTDGDSSLTNEKRDNDKNKKILYRLGNLSDGTISLLASLVVGLMLTEPLIISIVSIIDRSVDYYLLLSWNIIRSWIFPAVCIISFVIYFLILLKIRNENNGLLYYIKKNPVFVIFALAVILMIVSQFYNGIESTVDKVPDFVRGESFDMQYSYFIFLLFCASQVRSESHKHNLIRIHLFCSIFLAVSGFIQWKSKSSSVIFEDWHEWSDTFRSIFVNLNYYGYYLAVTVSLAAANLIGEKNIIWKIGSAVIFIINTVALSINNSTGAWIGAAFGILFLAISRFIIDKKINIQIIVVVFVFIICLYFPGKLVGSFDENVSTLTADIGNIISGDKSAESAGSGRWIIWTTTMDIIKINPWFGIGFEGVVMRQYAGPPYMSRPHNEFMQYALFYGIPMALMYIIGCFTMFLRALKKKKNLDSSTLACLTAAFGYLVSSFFGLTVFSTAMYLFIFLGMGYVREDVKHVSDIKCT